MHRAFHISEDVFAGYNHTLRGARTKFVEYISVGKGRDMGFDSINSFESKVRKITLSSCVSAQPDVCIIAGGTHCVERLCPAGATHYCRL